MAPLHWNWWALFAPLSSIIIGQLHVLLQMRPVGGGARSIGNAYKAVPESAIVIVGIDAIGGFLLMGLLLLVAPTGPKEFIQLVKDAPPVGWAVVGFAGPFVSDRSFVGSFVRGKVEQLIPLTLPAEPRHPEGSSDAWRLRNEAVHSLVDALWKIVKRAYHPKLVALRTCIEEQLESGKTEATDFVRYVEDFYEVGKKVKRTTPPTVATYLRLFASTDHPSEQVEIAKSLAFATLNTGEWSPVEVFC